jgi:outer membrane murein-binding lipoprotein Lpp
MNADEIAKFLEELNSQKQDLEKFDETVASLYARRCKKSKEELLALMAKGGWLTAKEAYDWGFVDEITNYEEDAAPIIDDNLATSMVSAGIPLPKSMPVKEDTGNKFLRAIKRALALLNEDNRATDTVSLDGSDNRIGVEVAPKNNNQSMKLELLSVAVGADITNEATLTADQLDKVEAAIKTSNEAKAQLEAKVESLNAQIADLNAKVEELGKQPGATTSDVTVKGGEAEAPGADAKADAQNLLKQLL